jgi:WD40 repeat protein
VIAEVVFSVACSVETDMAQPLSTLEYRAAFIDGARLSIFPFNGSEIAVRLPAALGGVSFSRDGRILYGIMRRSPSGESSLAAVHIQPASVVELAGSHAFSAIYSLAVGENGRAALVSATRRDIKGQTCGLFALDLETGAVTHVLGNPGDGCDYLSSWTKLSLSPNGKQAVGTSRKGQLALINLQERRIEKLWTGTEAFWSPNGKWIAALSFATPANVEIIDASDLSKRRKIGSDGGMGRVAWSPDSRYLLVWESDPTCGIGGGYYGTLHALDITSGAKAEIASSRCRVHLATTGWVSASISTR